MIHNPLRRLVGTDEVALGAWSSIPGAFSAEIMSRSGFDYVCVDAQHGVIDYAAAADMIQAIEVGGSCPLVRVPWNEPSFIGKVLDAGALGVIVPMVNSAEEAAAAASAVRYPPLGARSWGPTRAKLAHDYTPAGANEALLCIAMVETAEALDNVDAIASTPGIDGLYVGPSDLSISLGLAPGNNDDDETFAAAIAAISTAAANAGVFAGIHSNVDVAPLRLEQGYRFVTVSSDAVALRAAATAELARMRGTESSTDQGDGY